MLELVPIKHMFRYSNLTGSAKAEFRMRTLVNRKEGRRSLGSVTKSLVAVGATSALMLAGLAFVAVSPASAATTSTATASAASAIATTTATLNGSVTSGANAATLIQFCIGSQAVVQADVNISAVTCSGGTIVVATPGTLAINTAATPVTGSAAALTPGATYWFNVEVTDSGGNAYGTPLSFTAATALTLTSVNGSSGTGLTLTSAGGGGAGAVTYAVTTAGTAGCSITSGVLNATSAGTCTVTVSQAAAGAYLSSASSATLVTFASTVPTQVVFTIEPPASASAGTVLPTFTVSVKESNGVVDVTAPYSTDTISLVSACTLAGTTSVQAVGGVATFSAVAINSGSNCQLIATDTTRTLSTATSTVVALIAGTATRVVFTTVPPTSVTTASTVLAVFRASVEDVNGNVVTSGTGATDTIAITSPCTLGGTTTAVAIAGVATFSALTINVTGACVLTATDASRTLTAATATTTVGTPQTALVLSTVKGTVGKALNLATTGGTGTGALSYTVAAGSSAGCTVSGASLHAARAGTCLVTATKAGSTTYIAVSSAATRVTFVVPFQATRVAGTVTVGRTSTITIVGSGFSGRPRIICNVAGVTARVTGDTGRTLRVIVTVRAGVKRGVHTFTVILANGKRTSVKFSLR